MFNNIKMDMIGVCQPQITKEWQYAAMLEKGVIPVAYVSRKTMDKGDEILYKDIIQQIPDTTGIVIPVSYLRCYE